MVAALTDLSGFRCQDCAEAERRGGDLKEKRSGEKASCSGPKAWSYAGGAVKWTGCPRLALTHRVGTWISYRNRTQGRLTLTEMNRAPALLLEAFAVIESALDLRDRHAAEMRAKQQAKARGGKTNAR